MDTSAAGELRPAAETRPAGAWRVLFAFAGLAALVGVVVTLVLARTGRVDPHAAFAEAFETRELPFGLVPDFAADVPLGQRWVNLRAPDSVQREEAAARARSVLEVAAVGAARDAQEGEEKFAWKKLVVAPATEPPSEAILLFTGSEGRAGVNAVLDVPSAGSLDMLGNEGGVVAVDSGTFDWDAFEPRWIHLRRFARPGVYTDSVRLDVSAQGRWCALTVVWPQGSTGSKERAFELARALVPKPKTDAQR